MARLNHYKSVEQIFSLLLNDLLHGLGELFSRISGEPYQNHAGAVAAAGKYQPAEVLVFSEQYAFFAMSLLDQLAVNGAFGYFTHSQNIMAFGTQNSDDAEIATLISQKPQFGGTH